MKSKCSLSIVLSLFAAQALIGAEAPKKSAKKSATPEAPAAAPAKSAPDAAAAPAPEIKDPVAVVEGEEIKKAELDAAVDAMMAQRGAPAGAIPPEQKAGLYRMIIDDIIIERLINKRSAGIKISDEEVETTLAKATAGHSPEEVKAQLEKAGQTMERVKEQIRTSLRLQAWVNEQTKGQDEVTDAEAEDFYKKNPEQFKMPEQVKASHILLMVKADATPEVVVEKEKAAKAICERIKKGEDFATLAKELSEDPGSKQNGGDLDFFTKDRMVPEFANVAFAQKKDEVSQPVRSQFGYHIIKTTDRKEAETVSFESAKPKLLAYLKQQKKQQAVQKVAMDLRAKAEVKINLPEPPAPPEAPAAAAAAPAAAPAPAAAK